MDDLRFLAEYDPECFAKTCENVVYNFPEAKPIMEQAGPEAFREEKGQEPDGRQDIERILDNLKRLEINDYPELRIDNEKVKSLLGDLYMELLFPHNDQYTFIDAADSGNRSAFDKKA